MSRKKPREWIVQRKFEPTRLSPAILERAYGTLVPPHMRVLRVPTDQWVASPTVRRQTKERSRS